MPTVYTAQQKALIAQFTTFTNTDKTKATKALKESNWNLQQAVNTHLNGPAQTISATSRNSLSKVFDKYKDVNAADSMDVEGTMKYLEALDIAVDGVGSFVVQEIVQSPSMGEIRREGFISGWSTFSCDTLDKQKTFVKQRISTLSAAESRDTLRKTYKYAFRLPLTEKNQKTIDKDTALAMWSIFFTAPSVAWQTSNHDWLELWTEFFTQSNAKGVNADVWDQTFKFAEEVMKDETLSWWDELASWPGVIDDFIEWLKENKGIGGKTGDTDEMEY